MKAINPDHLWAPFVEPVMQSQQAFRQIMKAMAEPGTLVNLSNTYRQGRSVHAEKMPLPGYESAFVVALSLLDRDTSIWVSPVLATPIFLDNLRFHCGSRITDVQQEADFAFITLPELESFTEFKSGNEEQPQLFATIITLVRELSAPTLESSETAAWPATPETTILRLTGPGIKHETYFGLSDFTVAHATLLSLNQQRFPLGYDLLFASSDSLVGLPRSTCTEAVDLSHKPIGGQLCMSR
jgi:alpha-D-ribose 1-methylphosphonate 5-triphosphate synthase subunit PhnH